MMQPLQTSTSCHKQKSLFKLCKIIETPPGSKHLLKILAQLHRGLAFPDLHGSGLIASTGVGLFQGWANCGP